MSDRHRALVIGNGESRSWFTPKNYRMSNDVVTWGCNAIYRDGYVDALVSIDYAMQQEIYDSGYCVENPEWPPRICYFANWSVVPAGVANMLFPETSFLGFPGPFIHKSKNRTDNCVISGKDPQTLREKIEAAMEMYPHLDMKDLKMKMEKDVGVWITYVGTNDIVESIDYPVGWSAGNTALYLASKPSMIKEVYMLGFDLSSYDDPLNNVYKGTKNYLPATAKGFNQVNWYNQMEIVFKAFHHINFFLVDSSVQFEENNVSHITKNELCDALEITEI
ncbi:MAG: hypothetical protein QGH83_07855 [Candidatus Pacebacteria bacterium]|nr:hypothetical protein [Candidatus Paceibacterota bacterium]